MEGYGLWIKDYKKQELHLSNNLNILSIIEILEQASMLVNKF